MDGHQDIIEFFLPSGNERNLYVTNISPTFEDATEVQVALHKLFSGYGLIYEVQVFTVADTAAPPGSAPHNRTAVPSNITPDVAPSARYYAFIKFYSAQAAREASSSLHGRRYLKGQTLRVRMANRKKGQNPKQTLHITKCYEMANYYLGFNGWTTKIISMDGIEETVEGVVWVSCTGIVELHLPEHGVSVTGVGFGQMSCNVTDYAMKLEVMCRAKKRAYQAAVARAFSRIILVVLPSGKVFADVNSSIEDILEKEALLDSDRLLKVTDLGEDENLDMEAEVDVINQQILAELEG